MFTDVVVQYRGNFRLNWSGDWIEAKGIARCALAIRWRNNHDLPTPNFDRDVERCRAASPKQTQSTPQQFKGSDVSRAGFAVAHRKVRP